MQFALTWWLTKTTDSATTLAIAAMMSVLPSVFISPFAGALVDRWNRRIVVMVADGVIALATVVLALLYGLGVVQIWHVYVLMLIRATAGGFHWPAMGAATALRAPEKHLSRVVGMNQTLLGAVGIGAPPLGALLLELLPMQSILAIDVGTAALAIVPLSSSQSPSRNGRTRPREQTGRCRSHARYGTTCARGSASCGVGRAW